MPTVLTPVIPITSSPAIENVAAAALRDRRLRIETIRELEDTFRADNDNLPGDNSTLARVQAALFTGTLSISSGNLFLAQLLGQQSLLESNDADFLSFNFDVSTFSQPAVTAALNQPQFYNSYAVATNRYGLPIVQSLLV